MTSPLQLIPPPYTGEAEISEDGRYRYTLWRTWDVTPAPGYLTPLTACFILLNPSTADASVNDPTITRCMERARRMKCGRMVVVNLFALRATDPARLRDGPDPIGPRNDEHITEAIWASNIVIAGWGVHGTYLNRDKRVRTLVEQAGAPLHCLGVTREGHPRHPLYVSYATPLTDYTWRAR